MARVCDFFELMFKKCRNGKIPSLKLESALENLQLQKAIIPTATLPKDWAAESGGFVFENITSLGPPPVFEIGWASI